MARTLLAGVVLILCSCVTHTEPERIGTGSGSSFDSTEALPKSAGSIAELKELGEVVEIHADLSVLLYFAPEESVGYGRALIYKRSGDSWLLEKATEEVLLPKAKLDRDQDLVVTREASLNDRSKVEVLRVSLDDLLKSIDR